VWRGPSKAKVVVRNEYTQAVGEGDLAVCMHGPATTTLYKVTTSFVCLDVGGCVGSMHACTHVWVSGCGPPTAPWGVVGLGWVDGWNVAAHTYMCARSPHTYPLGGARVWWWVHAPMPAPPGVGARVQSMWGEVVVMVVVVVEWALASYMWWGHTQA